MKDANITPGGSIYGTYYTEYGAWGIQTQNVTCYLLVGQEKAMLIDTAYGEGDLPALIASITNLPLIVVNTHGHYDHTSGNAFFKEVWMGKGGEGPAGDAEKRTKLPYPDYEIHSLEDGQIFDLGGRQVEAIAIGAHHVSSFAFLDKKEKSLYTGDEIEAAQVLLNVRGDDLEYKEVAKLHLANLHKLKQREAEFQRMLPAHNGGPLSNEYLDDFIALSERILEDKVEPCDTVAGFGWPNFIMGGDKELMRLRYGKASFVCKR